MGVTPKSSVDRWIIPLPITPIESGYLGAAIRHFFILPKCALGTWSSVGCDFVEVIGVLWCFDFVGDIVVSRQILCTLGSWFLEIAYVSWGSWPWFCRGQFVDVFWKNDCPRVSWVLWFHKIPIFLWGLVSWFCSDEMGRCCDFVRNPTCLNLCTFSLRL